MNYINLTPHAIRLNDGRNFDASGSIARVSSVHSDFVNDLCDVTFGPITGLPDPQQDVLYIVSGVVAAAAAGRPDVVAPATGHKDCVRENGQVVSVPGFVRAAK
jgi:hypothetical protein